MSPNAQSLRRFLQAPEKVRFPVMAPLTLGVICVLMFVLVILVEVFAPFLNLAKRHERITISAYSASGRAWALDRGDIGSITWSTAREMDWPVENWLKVDDEIRSGTIAGWFHSKEWVQRMFGTEPGNLRRIAESRLNFLSGSAPAWAATARLCSEKASWGMPASGYRHDYHLEVSRAAKAYSRLLGRVILPADLAPLVPNGRCE